MPSISARQADLARETPLLKRLSVRIWEAAVLTGLPLSTLQALVADGTLRSMKVGRARLIQTASLIKLVEGRVPSRGRRAGARP